MARELNDCLKKELCPKSDEGWLRGRSGFLETFLIKGFVFRSPEMKRLDQQAVSNIRDQIAECKQILRDEYSVEVLT
jgi:predicted metal-dependent HD superfamily phosphohydrolase